MTYATEALVADRVSTLREEAEEQRRGLVLQRFRRLQRRARCRSARARRARSAVVVQVARMS